MVPNVLAAVNFPVAEEGDGLFHAPNYDHPVTQTRYVRDYYPVGGQFTMETLNVIRWIANPHGIPLTLHSFQQVAITSNDYIPQFDTRLPDGAARSTLFGILDEAARATQNCALGTGQLASLKRELDLATWINIHSFVPEWVSYRFTWPQAPLVNPTDLQTMANDAYDLLKMATTAPTSATWPTDPVFRAKYTNLFTLVRNYWQLGGYDTWY